MAEKECLVVTRSGLGRAIMALLRRVALRSDKVFEHARDPENEKPGFLCFEYPAIEDISLGEEVVFTWRSDLDNPAYEKHMIADVRAADDSVVIVAVIVPDPEDPFRKTSCFYTPISENLRHEQTPAREDLMPLRDILAQSDKVHACRNAACRRSPATLRCSRCKRARYCGAECQRADWAKHKAGCKNE